MSDARRAVRASYNLAMRQWEGFPLRQPVLNGASMAGLLLVAADGDADLALVMAHRLWKTNKAWSQVATYLAELIQEERPLQRVGGA